MTDAKQIVQVVSAIESFLPIVVGLVRDLKDLISGSGNKSVEEILQEADRNWAEIIAAAKKELGQ